MTMPNATVATATTASAQRGCLARRWRTEARSSEMRRRMRETGGRRARAHPPRADGDASSCPETTTRGWRRHSYEWMDAVMKQDRCRLPMRATAPADQAGAIGRKKGPREDIRAAGPTTHI